MTMRGGTVPEHPSEMNDTECKQPSEILRAMMLAESPCERQKRFVLRHVWAWPPRELENSPTNIGIPPTPDRAPNPHFEEKRVSGSKNPPFPLVLQKGVFCQKNPLFSTREHIENGIFCPKTPFSSPCEGGGKWGFLDPETLFSRKWGFGALSGVRGIATQTKTCKNTPIKIQKSLYFLDGGNSALERGF